MRSEEDRLHKRKLRYSTVAQRSLINAEVFEETSHMNKDLTWDIKTRFSFRMNNTLWESYAINLVETENYMRSHDYVTSWLQDYVTTQYYTRSYNTLINAK